MAKKTSKKLRPSLKKVNLRKPSFKKPKLGFRHLVTLLVLASLVLFGVSSWFALTDPEEILDDMLAKSLSTQSITRTVSQKSGQNSAEQTLYVSFSPDTFVHSATKLEEASGRGKTTKVTTETLGTKDADHVRYVSIDVPEGSARTNFDNVLNVWGKREKDEKSGRGVSFLNEGIFMIVPFGNLSVEQRKQLVSDINKAELYKYKEARKEFINGRPVMVYKMSVSPEKLVQIIANYVKLTGVGDDSELDPSQYEGSPPVNIEMTVDIMSRHLSNINFSDSKRSESYGPYGLSRPLTLPKDSIDINELQDRLDGGSQ